ncbi:MAG: hypothetical protein K0Q55_2063, partial [Verrucomicrobia bacterium]|nr:hypothetical protein [Verrucomicrobiota bacterium]
ARNVTLLLLATALVGCRTSTPIDNSITTSAPQKNPVSLPTDVPSFTWDGISYKSYDKAVVEAIRTRWFEAVTKYEFRNSPTGTVRISYRLHSQGHVSDLKIEETSVSEAATRLCQQAITDPAPYPEWPEAMRKEIGKDFRDAKFTFRYE